MNARDARRGGLEVWAPAVVPPIGVDLSSEQALAVAFRHLAAIGFAENIAGHITWQPDGQTDMFVNPWGLWWQELTASDICVADSYGGEIDSATRAADLAARIGSCTLTILGNQGVIATGRNLAEAIYRAASIERGCKLAYDVMLTGKKPVQMNWADMAGMQRSLIERAADLYWAGAALMTIKTDPAVLN
jgi:ribulose-5-phosphate 4-epimerase/fuculose-1-phosphate aldolase